ncbi:MAG TPA: cytochrome c oxidase subunit 3 [Acidisarcina sp.]
MPATFTRTPVDTERRNPGIGGKPPVDRRPTGGGGDGDNWDNQPGGRGPGTLLRRYRIAIAILIAGDVMLFAALATVLFVSKGRVHIDGRNQVISDWHPVMVPAIFWLNTIVLLLSSLTMEMARRQLFHEVDVMEEWLGLGKPAARRATPWLLGTLGLGVLFLAGQLQGWRQLQIEGVFFRGNQSNNFFYLITGTHAAHLFLGLLALCASLGALALSRRIEVRQVVVDCTAWYWHSMGVFWIFIFLLLAYFQ